MTPEEIQISREDILSMESGRKLDKLIALHVMGQSVYHYDKDHEENCYYELIDSEGYAVDPFGGERDTEEEAWDTCSYYSESLNDAWEVVEGLQKSHLYTDVRTCADFYEVWITDHSKGNQTVTVAHPELPEAICKAALLAVLGEEQE